MNKIILCISFLFYSFLSHAQKNEIQKISILGMVVTTGSTSFEGNVPPFSVGGNFIANLSVGTNKTYHNLLYGFRNNMLRTVHGLGLPKDWDIYLAVGKILHNKDGHAVIGGEKMFKMSDKVKMFIFAEGGMDFNSKGFLTLGIIMNARFKIWERKKN